MIMPHEEFVCDFVLSKRIPWSSGSLPAIFQSKQGQRESTWCSHDEQHDKSKV